MALTHQQALRYLCLSLSSLPPSPPHILEAPPILTWPTTYTYTRPVSLFWGPRNMGAPTSKTSVIPSLSVSNGQSSLPKYEPIWVRWVVMSPEKREGKDYDSWTQQEVLSTLLTWALHPSQTAYQNAAPSAPSAWQSRGLKGLILP